MYNSLYILYIHSIFRHAFLLKTLFFFAIYDLLILSFSFFKLLANSTFRNELLTSPALYNEGAVLIIGNHYIGCMLEGPSIVFDETLIHNLNVQFRTCPIPEDNCK